jgi:nucleotide-binding universal stress UspA family protein
MKYLIPIDGSQAALAPISYLTTAARRGIGVEAILLNVQPLFNFRVAQFSQRADRDALREDWSRGDMAAAVAMSTRAGILYRAVTALGPVAAHIAATAERENVDEILIGVGRSPAWLRWLKPSLASAVGARTNVPVAVIASGNNRLSRSWLVAAGIAGMAGIAALVLAAG